MGQVSKSLRRSVNGYAHFCIACKEMHPLPDGWSFNGDLEKPTFSPSFKHSGMKIVTDEGGNWTGEWVLDEKGDPVPYICHYILTNGILHYCSDCTHSMAGQSVPLAELPKGLRDED
jgi:hypothetical protein